ncbi:MAG: hypothetical protein ACOCNE_09295, partial [Prevotella pectinovora]
MKKRILYMAMMAAAFASCQDNTIETEYPHDASLDIKVGSIDCGSADAVVVENITKSATTRASQKAEDVEWLKDPLLKGIDVSYYLRSDENKNTSTAVLKLLPETDQVAGDSTKYSFNYKDENGQETQKPAQWKGNAGHVFHGFYIPEGISNGEIGNQSESEISNEQNAESYYDKLWRYLSMPPNHEIMATVGYVRLPFRHRLSRVLAYVLIDPDLKTSIKDNIISFENVKVLEKVEGTTPKWTTARKVVPHSMGTSGSVNKKLEQTDENFLVFRNTTSNTFVYPTDDAWANVKAAYDNNKENSGYEEINYGQVRCFDIIVRPTYTSSALVMYDEDMSNGMNAAKYADETNSIDFVVDLVNGLSYNKTFKFDLDANYQTAVFLRISREKVDYQTMGSELWQQYEATDGYYGVDNDLNHRLSLAGGSWQRAYRNSSFDPGITDGDFYKEQYVDDTKWIGMFKNAVMPTDTIKANILSDNHWGDYFVLDKDITIDVSEFPADFIFTGHLDGRGHTIVLTGERGYLFDGLNGTYEAEAGQANCHKEGEVIVPEKGYRAEVMNLKIKGGKLFSSAAEAD